MLGLTLLANPLFAAMGALAWLCHGRAGRAGIAAALVLAVPAAWVLPALALVIGLADLGAVYVAAASAILHDIAVDLPSVGADPVPALAHAAGDAVVAFVAAGAARTLRRWLADRSVTRAFAAAKADPAPTREVTPRIERRRAPRPRLRLGYAG
jgi:hypothetical protein